MNTQFIFDEIRNNKNFDESLICQQISQCPYLNKQVWVYRRYRDILTGTKTTLTLHRYILFRIEKAKKETEKIKFQHILNVLETELHNQGIILLSENSQSDFDITEIIEKGYKYGTSECAICYEELDNPVFLKCSHSFHANCISNYQNGLHCPFRCY